MKRSVFDSCDILNTDCFVFIANIRTFKKIISFLNFNKPLKERFAFSLCCLACLRNTVKYCSLFCNHQLLFIYRISNKLMKAIFFFFFLLKIFGLVESMQLSRRCCARVSAQRCGIKTFVLCNSRVSCIIWVTRQKKFQDSNPNERNMGTSPLLNYNGSSSLQMLCCCYKQDLQDFSNSLVFHFQACVCVCHEEWEELVLL